MKNTKKITNIHDYSKEVDKIIATGKPIVEQFMDLMGLMDVTFIDSERTVEKSSAVENDAISACCGAKIMVVNADEGTSYWTCSKCGEPCNIMDQGGRRIKPIRNDITTAKVHPKKKSPKTNTDDYWEALLKGEE